MAVLADEYGPFNAGPGASVGEPQWGHIMASFSSSGVSPEVLNTLKVTQRAAGVNMSVDVASGQMFLNGHQGRWFAVTNLPKAPNNGTTTRYDRIIGRSDRAANTVVLDVLPGSAGVPAALTQTEVVYEAHIATVTVAVGAVTIPNASIAYRPTWAAGRAGAPSAAASLAGAGSFTPQLLPSLPSQTILNWADPPTVDSAGFWDPAHPERFTVNRLGLYDVRVQLFVDESGVSGANLANIAKGYRNITIGRDGGASADSPQDTIWGSTPVVGGAAAPYNTAPTSRWWNANGLVYLSPTEWVMVQVVQNSGGTMQTLGGTFSIAYIGAS